MPGREVRSPGLAPCQILTDLCEQDEIRVSVVTPGDHKGSGLDAEGFTKESPTGPSPTLLLPGLSSTLPPTPAESHHPASAHIPLHLEHLFCSDLLLP